MEIQGKVIAVLAPREGTSKTGNPWKVQEYVIETEEQYPKKMCFEVFGNDRISQFASMLVVGNTVKVSFDIDARQWNDRWFNSIRAWKVELPVQEPMAEIPPQAIPELPVAESLPLAPALAAPEPFPPAQPEAAATGESTDDLPF